MKINKQTREAFHVIGHLLETNGTTNSYAKDECGSWVDAKAPLACQWCLEGAVEVIAHTVFPGCDVVKLGDAVGKYLGLEKLVALDDGPRWSFRYNLVRGWDVGCEYGPELSRALIIEKLKSA